MTAILSAESYGFIPSASPTDQTTALLAAVADAVSGAAYIYVTPGYYSINGTIECPTPMRGILGTGLASISWVGAANVPMFVLEASNQQFEDLFLDGGISFGRTNGLEGIRMLAGTEGYFQQAGLRRVTMRYFAKGLRVERPNPLSGGQNEETVLDHVKFESNAIGVSLEHGNIDYWTYRGCVWANNVVGLQAEYLTDQANANGHSFIGCVATGDGSAGTKWIYIHNDQDNNAWVVENCQTENIEWGIHAIGLIKLIFNGGVVTSLRLDNVSGMIITNGATWDKSGSYNRGVQIDNGYLNVVNNGATYTKDGIYYNSMDEWAAAGGVAAGSELLQANESILDHIINVDNDIPRGGGFSPRINASKKLFLGQRRTQAYLQEPTAELKGAYSHLDTTKAATDVPIVRLRDALDNVVSEFGPAGQTFGTSPPSSGVYLPGHIVWNSSPAVGSPMGWMCLTSSPLTWGQLRSVLAVSAANVADSADMCSIFGTLVDLSGNALSGVKIYFIPILPAAAGSNFLSDTVVSATTNASGYFTIDLPRTVQVKVTCEEAGVGDVTKTVPNAASQDFSTW